MSSHRRRRSRSSSDSSPSSSSDDEHSKQGRSWKNNVSEEQRATSGVRASQSNAASFSQPPSALQNTMSGPGFPSNPPPYTYDGSPYGDRPQGTMNMPGAGGYAPPPGPPPSFPSHGPGFPSAEHEKSTYNAQSGAPDFPTSPHDAPSFPTSPHEGPSFPTSPHDTPSFPTSPQDGPKFPAGPGGVGERGFTSPGGMPHGDQASQFAQHRPPPSGVRIPLTATAVFPTQQAGQPVAYDLDGSPVYIGSALMDRSVHPCKICPRLNPPCRAPYGGAEFEHRGRFDLLPFDPATMEWVHTGQGRIPQGRRPVEGGYEEHGGKLYHALATVQNVKVPGKAGEHLVRV
ncbi:hypothetical protein EIP86_005946 [Pleurotus ostreatoroseus]|nr:hypothetical protein EIP86_005946 [Pleurotus ostreatoroseus]